MAKQKRVRQKQTAPLPIEIAEQVQKLEAEYKQLTELKEFFAWEEQLFASPFLSDQQKIEAWQVVVRAKNLLPNTDE